MTNPSLRPVMHDPDLAAMASELLRRPSALSDLNARDADRVVTYMRLLRCDEGAVLMQEGDQDDNSHMLLILDGEVSVEHTVVSRTDPVVVTVLSPGSLIGEMGLLDGAPRAATCVALSPLLLAALTRVDLRRLMADEPAVAAKLLASISQRLAERLREAGRQQMVYSQLVRAMQGEIDDLHEQLQCVMNGSLRRNSSEV